MMKIFKMSDLITCLLLFVYWGNMNDFDFWCFNATFSNISAISWRPVLVVEEARVLRLSCHSYVIHTKRRSPSVM